MSKMSLCIPKLLDGISKSDNVASRYEHVISIDRQMRKVVTKIPSAILRDHGASGKGPEWLTLARRTLAITAADKVSETRVEMLEEYELRTHGTTIPAIR